MTTCILCSWEPESPDTPEVQIIEFDSLCDTHQAQYLNAMAVELEGGNAKAPVN